MLYLLDTDILTSYQQGHPLVCQHASAVQSPDEITLSVISVEEQLSGWYTLLRRAKGPDDLSKVYQHLTDAVNFIAHFRVVSFSKPAIHRFDQLKAQKINIGGYDLRIAAIVLEVGATLVTHNTSHFVQIPGLQFVDWMV
jgi:tRNA(fMet)-specific endonuclease VapC